METRKSDVRWLKKKKKKKEYPGKDTCATAGGGIRKSYLSMRLMLFNWSWAAWKLGNYNLWNASMAPSMVHSSIPIFLGKVYLRRDKEEMYWAPKCGIWIQTSLAVKLLRHLKYHERGNVWVPRGMGEAVGKQIPSCGSAFHWLTQPLKNEICSLDKIWSNIPARSIL